MILHFFFNGNRYKKKKEKKKKKKAKKKKKEKKKKEKRWNKCKKLFSSNLGRDRTSDRFWIQFDAQH